MSVRKVPIEVSARHVHLSAEHLTALFGQQATLNVFRKISQPGQFAAVEFVTIIGPRGQLTARVVGPLRESTQVELTISECRQLGIKEELRLSGDLEGTPGCRLRGPHGEVEIKQGVIVARRHLHISPQQAINFNLQHGQIISIATHGQRPVTFHDVFVRCREGVDELSFMIDTDEANAAGLEGGEEGIII